MLATNIAETAITIEDVTCVINSGRLKEKSYDPYTGVSTLQSAWISKVRMPLCSEEPLEREFAASENSRGGRNG